jgi:hypothetical protein
MFCKLQKNTSVSAHQRSIQLGFQSNMLFQFLCSILKWSFGTSKIIVLSWQLKSLCGWIAWKFAIVKLEVLIARLVQQGVNLIFKKESCLEEARFFFDF